jgi:hypothetical protein
LSHAGVPVRSALLDNALGLNRAMNQTPCQRAACEPNAGHLAAEHRNAAARPSAERGRARMSHLSAERRVLQPCSPKPNAPRRSSAAAQQVGVEVGVRRQACRGRRVEACGGRLVEACGGKHVVAGMWRQACGGRLVEATRVEVGMWWQACGGRGLWWRHVEAGVWWQACGGRGVWWRHVEAGVWSQACGGRRVVAGVWRQACIGVLRQACGGVV